MDNLKKITIVLFCLFLSFQTKSQTAPETPKLVIGIVVEQMRYDYIYRYWEKLEEGGFKRLVNKGTFFKNAHHEHFFTQTGSGFASIFTGTSPSNHGIIANSWFDRDRNIVTHCTQDKRVGTVGSRGSIGRNSPKHLLSNTIGDVLKLSNFEQSKIISIGMNPKAAVLAGGKLSNATYWFDSKTGNWISSTYYMKDLPKWVERFNNKQIPKKYMKRNWNTILPLGEYTESLPDENYNEKGFGPNANTFPYKMKTLQGDYGYGIVKETPFGNTYTTEFAIQNIKNEELGKDNYPDLLLISYSPTAEIDNKFGVGSVEIEDTYLRLDMDIAKLIRYVEKKIGKENVLFFLTSDHGSNYTESYRKEKKLPNGTFNQATAFSLLKVYLEGFFGKKAWIENYHNQQFYFDKDLMNKNKISYKSIEETAAKLLMQFDGVVEVVTSDILINNPLRNKQKTKIQNNYHVSRSGDLIIKLRSGWTERSLSEEPNFANGYNYDTHVPLIWYGWKIPKKTVVKRTSIYDIAPTLSVFLNVAFPEACTGNPLNLF